MEPGSVRIIGKVFSAIPALVALVVAAPPTYDLSPYFLKDPALEAGYRAFKMDRLKEAETQLRAFLSRTPDGSISAAARFLFAESLDAMARATKSDDARRDVLDRRAVELEKLVDYAPLAGPVHFALGQNAQQRGAVAEALAHYRQVPDGGSYHVLARVAAAELLLAGKGGAEEALGVLRSVAGEPSPPATSEQIRFLTGRAELALGRTDDAVATFRALWAERPGKHFAVLAAAELDRLKKRPKGIEDVLRYFGDPDSREERTLKRLVKRFKKAFPGAGKAALFYAKGVIWTFDPDKRKKGVAALRKAAKGSDVVLKAYALDRVAWSLAQDEQPEEALALYRKVASLAPDLPLCADALTDAADLARRLGNDELAGALLDDLVKRFPNHVKRVEQRWKQAWQTWRNGAFAKAAALFDRIAADYGAVRGVGDATWAERALYWRARSELNAGDRGKALETWASVVSRYPLTYYSHLAWNRVAELDPARAAALRPHKPLEPYDIKTLVDFDGLGLAVAPELDTPVELVRIGLFEAARQDLAMRAKAHRLGADGLTLLLSLGLREGHYALAPTLVRWHGTLTRYPDEADERLWKLAFPLPWWSDVDRSADEWRISPWFVIALIRHESSYNPQSVSYAKAVGLTQLLVGTAQTVASKLIGGARPTFATLKKPEVNMRIGSRFLKALMVHFADNEALALAAYNAGPARARAWWRAWLDSGRTATDEFIEEIPYRETQGYVKSVLGSYGAYRYLYGTRGDAAFCSIPLEADLPQKLGPYFATK